MCQAIWSLSFLEMENRIKVLLPPFLNIFFLVTYSLEIFVDACSVSKCIFIYRTNVCR